MEDGLDQRESEERRGSGRIDHPQSEERRGAALGSHGVRGNDFAEELDAVERADPVVLQQRAAELGERIERAVRPEAAEARLQALIGTSDGVARSPVASDAGGLV